MRPGVLVVAKAPVPGQVKTRLSGAIGDRAAADVAAAALLDTLDTCERVFPPEQRLAAVAGELHEAERAGELIDHLAGWRVIPQRGNGLGPRLANAHADAGTLFGRPVVQIGMDTPHLTPEHLTEVADLVDRPEVDAVLGPAFDGGWWVLALAHPRWAAGLTDVAMSTGETGQATHAMLVRGGAAVVGTTPIRDVDTPKDAWAVALAAPTSRFSLAWKGIKVELVSPTDAFELALSGTECMVHGLPGGPTRLPVDRWQQPCDATDDRLLAACAGPTLDIGCGPGRLTHGLATRGLPALGIDVALGAVQQTRARGGQAIQRDVFDVVPGEGRWDTVLLADGNIGIGGDPVRLLRRVRRLLAADGRALVEVAPPGVGVTDHHLHLTVAGHRSASFRWAVVGTEQLDSLARQAALRMLWVAEHRGRWFAQLGNEAIDP